MKLISFTYKFFLIFSASYTITTSAPPLHGVEFDEFNMTTVEIIKKYGYPIEIHTTETEDGYILKLYRIPHSRNSREIGFPILVVHGLLCDSSSYVLQGESSLGFFLSDEGYDVWLINLRGTSYTRAHKYLSPNSGKFWDFSWHENGIYDLPALVDYIREHTEHEDILYLGVSMGATAFFVMASEKPEYGKKIRGAALLGPVATLKHTRSSSRLLVPFRHFLRFLADQYKLREIFRKTPAYVEISRKLCNTTIIHRRFCFNIIYLFAGKDPKGTDQRVLTNAISHASDTSAKSVIHYLQLMKSGKFQQYDYGPPRNLIKYGQLSPPDYKLWSITTPMYLFVGPNDLLADPKDVMETLAPLPSVKDIYFVPSKFFSHFDLILERNAKEKLFYAVSRRLKVIINNGIYNAEYNSHYE